MPLQLSGPAGIGTAIALRQLKNELKDLFRTYFPELFPRGKEVSFNVAILQIAQIEEHLTALREFLKLTNFKLKDVFGLFGRKYCAPESDCIKLPLIASLEAEDGRCIPALEVALRAAGRTTEQERLISVAANKDGMQKKADAAAAQDVERPEKAGMGMRERCPTCNNFMSRGQSTAASASPGAAQAQSSPGLEPQQEEELARAGTPVQSSSGLEPHRQETLSGASTPVRISAGPMMQQQQGGPSRPNTRRTTSEVSTPACSPQGSPAVFNTPKSIVDDAVHGYVDTLNTAKLMEQFQLMESPAQQVVLGEALSRSGRERVVKAIRHAQRKRDRPTQAFTPLLNPEMLLKKLRGVK